MEKSEFTGLIEQGFNHIPFSREIVVDTDTALSLYLKLANSPYSYFLESVQGGEKWGRYSFIGLTAETVIKVYDYEVRVEKNGDLVEKYEVEDPLEWIENYQNQFNVPKLDNLPDFNGGLVGYFGYEIIRYIEPRFASLDKNIIQPLENEWGFIEVEKIGRNRWIKLTKEGEHASEFLP